MQKQLTLSNELLKQWNANGFLLHCLTFLIFKKVRKNYCFWLVFKGRSFKICWKILREFVRDKFKTVWASESRDEILKRFKVVFIDWMELKKITQALFRGDEILKYFGVFFMAWIRLFYDKDVGSIPLYPHYSELKLPPPPLVWKFTLQSPKKIDMVRGPKRGETK